MIEVIAVPDEVSLLQRVGIGEAGFRADVAANKAMQVRPDAVACACVDRVTGTAGRKHGASGGVVALTIRGWKRGDGRADLIRREFWRRRGGLRRRGWPSALSTRAQGCGGDDGDDDAAHAARA